MTEEWANVLVFPFRSNDKLLAKCVVIERVPLFTGNILSEDFLAFMLLFSSPSVSPLKHINFPDYGGRDPISKESLFANIVTDAELIQSLQDWVKYLEKKLNRKAKKTATKKSSIKAKGKLLSRQIVCRKY